MLRKKGLIFLVALISCLIICSFCYADYPLLTTITYSADPSCLEYNGVLYSYWSNDDNNNGGYQMHQITCLSTTDLKHWTNHGQVFDVPSGASWASYCWAPAVVYRNGYFWMYFGNNASGIGVAKSSSPTGPFIDAKGSALITPSMPNCNVQWCFDPGVLVDDDGRVYMFFGGGGPGNARAIEIGSDMISTVGTAVTIDAPRFYEDSWIHKYNGKYYYSYSSDFSQGAATIEYMMSSSPLSGYVAKGTVMPNPPDNNGNNNHHSIFQYKGNWYIAYHNRYVAIQQGIDTTYKRNACLDQLFYNTDDTMKLVVCTKSGLPLLGENTPTPTSRFIPTQAPSPTPTVTITATPTQRVNTPTVTPTPRRRTVTPTPTSRLSSTPTPTGGRNTPTPTIRSTGGYVVSYVIQSDWGNGATINVIITNKSTVAVNSWTLAFAFPGNQTIINLWNGTYTQSGASVSVKDAGFNANIEANGGSINFGFNINYSGTNTKPTSFTLNGTACIVQ